MTAPDNTPTVYDFHVTGGETCDCFGFAALDTDDDAIDVTGFAARMEIFDADGNPVLAMATADGTMVNGGRAGTFRGTVSQSVPNIAAAYRYELWVDDTLSSNHPWWEGRVVVALSKMGELP